MYQTTLDVETIFNTRPGIIVTIQKHRKADISLADQKASWYLCSPDTDYPVRKMSLLYLIMGQFNPHHILVLSLSQENADDLQSVGSVS